MKAVGTTATTIILIVLFITFFGIYIVMTNNQIQSGIQLNLESLQVLKLKSTFNLFNTSLGTTWFITTVQGVFRTADESIGCGYDDNRVEQGYWYQQRPDVPRDNLTDVNGNPIERIPIGTKYNSIDRNPHICYPLDSHIVEYMLNQIRNGGFLNLRNPIEAGDANGVRITMDNGNLNPSINLNISDSGISSMFAQNVRAEYANGVISDVTENYNFVYTSLRLMVAAGRTTVEKLLQLGDSPPQYTAAYQNNDTFSSAFENVIRIFIDQPGNDVATTIRINTEIFAADGSFQELSSGLGLVLHYDASIKYTDSSRVLPGSISPSLPWPTDSTSITSCYGYRNDPINDAGKFHAGIDIAPSNAGNEDIRAVESGTVVSTSDICNIQEPICGRGYGNYVLIDHGAFSSFYSHLAKDSITVSPGQTVSAGTVIGRMGTTGRSTGVHLHFEIRTDTARNPCEYIDCSLSTGVVCSADTTLISGATRGVYYYDDENSGTFVKRPISLEYKAEDYLSVLDCSRYNNPPVSTFNWRSPADMACCAGYLFSCNADIPNLDPNQQLTSGQATDDNIFPQIVCNSILLSQKLQCSGSGFSVG